ncbi:Nuclear factor related to kappa-B-binding, partial [Paramuricea clavata]
MVKRYGALFTCLASRAIHIEVADTMETDSFIKALRRFICRRSPVQEIRCDRGTNFIGAENELKRTIEEIDDEKVKTELLKDNIDWIKTPASASNFGGVWERQIRSIRNVINALMKEHGTQMDEEILRTFLCEAEATVNNRPFTLETLNDPLSEPPLSPSMLLTGKTKLVLPPPGEFKGEDMYCKKKWRRTQHLVQEFWQRWSKEYLQQLQSRSKWTQPKRNFTTGDVVLLREVQYPRNKWPLAKVVRAHPDDQGQVRSVTSHNRLGFPNEEPGHS